MKVSVYNKVLAQIKKKGRGSVFISHDFLGVSDQLSVNVALSNLVKNGILRRLAYGIFDYPITHPKLGVLPVSHDKAIDALKRKTGCTLQIDGAKAANLLGLSTQVPAQTVFFTDTSYPRDVKIGHWIIRLKRASPKVLAGAGQLAGCVLQAFRYLGKHNVDQKVIARLRRVLTKKDKQQLEKLLPYAPHWAHQPLKLITIGWNYA